MAKKDAPAINRREFIRASAAGLAALPVFSLGALEKSAKKKTTRIALCKTSDRKRGVKEVIRLLDVRMKGNKLFVKPNFNTADPFPASTHNDTLIQIIQEMKKRGAVNVIIGERSGPPETRKVMEAKGILALAQDLGFRIADLEELGERDWVSFSPPGNHWSNGFFLARPAVEADYSVSTCCLKTHQYGGVFTMSLKLAVGLTPKRLMRELHGSPEMRKMIAELNLGYKPQFIVMDGIETFVDGGPSTGKKAAADVVIAGTDRIAVDAAGVAILKELGSNGAIMETKIFDQEQIKRAVELGLGITGPQQIEFVTSDRNSRLYAEKINKILG